MKLKRLPITLFICSTLLSCSENEINNNTTNQQNGDKRTNYYYKLDISPYDGYVLAFHEDFLFFKYGQTNVNARAYRCELKDNEIWYQPNALYDGTSTETYLVGTFINNDTQFEMVSEKYKTGIYELTNMSAKGVLL